MVDLLSLSPLPPGLFTVCIAGECNRIVPFGFPNKAAGFGCCYAIIEKELKKPGSTKGYYFFNTLFLHFTQ